MEMIVVSGHLLDARNRKVIEGHSLGHTSSPDGTYSFPSPMMLDLRNSSFGLQLAELRHSMKRCISRAKVKALWSADFWSSR